MMSGLTLFTSIAPRTKRMVNGRDFGSLYQRACIDSWIGAGFAVVSLNTADEIEVLRKQAFPVRYVGSTNPRPTISEILIEASRCQTDLVGIINADCLLLGHPAVLSTVATAAKRGLVMMERVNINPRSLLPTGLTCLGFDAFIFVREYASRVTIDPELAFGEPWWDYWLPMELAASGMKLLRPQFPVVVHLDHEQGWSQSRWLDCGRKFMTHFSQSNGVNVSGFLDGLNQFLRSGSFEREDLGGFADWCFNWLRDHSERIGLSKEHAAGEFVGQMFAAITNFDGMHESTLALAQTRRELTILRGGYPLDDVVFELHQTGGFFTRLFCKFLIDRQSRLRSSPFHFENNSIVTDGEAVEPMVPLSIPSVDKERISGDPVYSEDCLRVWGQSTDFMSDPHFMAAYDAGMSSGHHIMRPEGSNEDIGIRWRIVTCCWAAAHAAQLGGDFVECGVNTGIMSAAVCKYIDFNATEKSFWLFDTFSGIPDDQISVAERAARRGGENVFYGGAWEHAVRTFAPYPKANLVRGRVPDTFSTVKIDRVAYLSIDMNIAFPEQAALRFFWPKLVSGAVVVFDDYNWLLYREQKMAHGDFAKSVGVQILPLPTGQGLLIKP
jgi:O-methyltransferase